MQKIEFTTSVLTFYLKGSIEGDEHFINFKVPNTILGMIPLGARTDNLATNQISSTTTNFKLQIKQLLIGLFIFLLGIDLLNDSFIIALIALVFGASTFIDAFECDLVVLTTSGQSLLIDFLIFEKEKAVQASQEINALIANRIDDTNVRVQTDKVVNNANANADRIIDAIKSDKE